MSALPLNAEESAVLAAMAKRSEKVRAEALCALRLASHPKIQPLARSRFLERAADLMLGGAL